MKSQHYLAVAALACLPLGLMAQPAPKVFTVDMAKVFEGHPQTQAQQAALKADEQKASERLQALEREVRSLADKLKEQQNKFDDPTLAATQKDAIRAEGQRIGQEMQAKQNEGQQLIQKTQNELQQRAQKFRAQVVGEIARSAAEVARRKGGTLVYDRGSLVYADPAYDITADVVAEVAKGARAQPAPPAKPAPTK
jgi:outer membrane protein